MENSSWKTHRIEKAVNDRGLIKTVNQIIK